MTRLVDDIDGSQAVTTMSFSLDGLSYEIDLSESHLDAFQQAMAPFVRVARKVPGGHRARDTAEAPPKEPVPKEPVPKERVPKEPAAKRPVAKKPAAKKPAAKRASQPNGHAVAADDVVTEVAATRPTIVNSPPFQQPKPNLAPTGSKPTRAPLVADPFNPGAHR
jgi:hypothetical protein